MKQLMSVKSWFADKEGLYDLNGFMRQYKESFEWNIHDKMPEKYVLIMDVIDEIDIDNKKYLDKKYLEWEKAHRMTLEDYLKPVK